MARRSVDPSRHTSRLVTNSADRLDERRDARVSLELEPQMADVDIDRSRIRERAVATHRSQELRPTAHAIRLGHQNQEQLIFRGGQRHGLRVPSHFARRVVKHDVPETQWREGAGVSLSSQQRLDAGAQLGEPDRLGHEIVGSRLQPRDDVGCARIVAEHDDRGAITCSPQATADAKAIGTIAQRCCQQEHIVALAREDGRYARAVEGTPGPVTEAREHRRELVVHIRLDVRHQDPPRPQELTTAADGGCVHGPLAARRRRSSAHAMARTARASTV